MKNGCEDKLLWSNSGKITAGSRNTGQQQYQLLLCMALIFDHEESGLKLCKTSTYQKNHFC